MLPNLIPNIASNLNLLQTNPAIPNLLGGAIANPQLLNPGKGALDPNKNPLGVNPGKLTIPNHLIRQPYYMNHIFTRYFSAVECNESTFGEASWNSDAESV